MEAGLVKERRFAWIFLAGVVGSVLTIMAFVLIGLACGG